MTFKFLPIILAALTLSGAIFFFRQREVLHQKVQDLLNRSKVTTSELPQPTPFIPVQKNTTFLPTVSVTPTVTPASQTKGGVLTSDKSNTTGKTTVKKTVATTTTTRTEIICTPVYGMANSCAEHTVVDTGLDTGTLYNLAAISYFGGLAAFIKAKKAKRA